MKSPARPVSRTAVVVLLLLATTLTDAAAAAETATEYGRHMYMEGILPSGEPLTAIVSSDVEITGELIVCGECHRRSGLGASEGESVAPPVVGEVLYEPYRLPVSRPPDPPVLRPAYDRDSLAASIRDGVSSNGEQLSGLMPRYPLSDEDMAYLIAYLESLKVGPDPGVTDTDIHFATIISDDVDPAARKALLDVMETFIEQKNTETRYETKRATRGPWHKDWVFKPYRKWVLHTWELTGPPSGWAEQLNAQYEAQPVFAVLNGLSNSSWQPVHEFCEQMRLPCLFPTTNLPVVDREDFYNVYLSKGMTMEAEAIAGSLADAGIGSITQIYRPDNEQSSTAAAALERALGPNVRSIALDDVRSVDVRAPAIVAWLGADDVNALFAGIEGLDAGRVYLSGALLAGNESRLGEELKPRAWLVYSHELPGRTARLLARSTGWFRIKRIYSKDYQTIQANAYFTMKTIGGALTAIHNYFNRDYLVESLEHMIDNATYTSVYPRLSLAPEQRFASKGSMIARFDEAAPDRLVAVAEWSVPE